MRKLCGIMCLAAMMAPMAMGGDGLEGTQSSGGVEPESNETTEVNTDGQVGESDVADTETDSGSTDEDSDQDDDGAGDEDEAVG